jgi:hypothetical protein
VHDLTNGKPTREAVADDSAEPVEVARVDEAVAELLLALASRDADPAGRKPGGAPAPAEVALSRAA